MSELRPGGTLSGSVAGYTVPTDSLTTVFSVTSQRWMWGLFAATSCILEDSRTESVAGGMAGQQG